MVCTLAQLTGGSALYLAPGGSLFYLSYALAMRLPELEAVALNRQAEENRLVLHALHYVPEKRSEQLEIVEDIIPLHEVPVSVRVEGDVASVAADGGDPIAVLHVGRGADVQAALEALYPRLAPDAAIVVDGASDAGVRSAIDSFRSAHGVTDPETATNGTASWRRGNSFKPGAASESSVKAAASAGSGGKLGSLLKRAKG
mgnify:CR=1 FL=1